ncbi:MAG: NAD(P)/FAD-dependent oxidoreductase, partial [Bacteroidetes bacterium]
VPNIPKFEGLRQYKGVLFHSAKWNHDVSLEEKRVGVVGNAASAIQFIPEIAPVAREVTVFQRSANWILPKQDRLYADWEKALVRRLPFLLKLYRFRIWALTGGLFFMMKKGNEWLRKYYEKQVIRYINKSVDDPKLRQKLIPDYPLGAKRILFSDNYYTALNRPNVRVVTSGIQSLTQQGIATRDGKEYPLDVVILATGFRSNPLLAGLDIRGRSGQSLAAAWSSGVKNYLGMMVSGFPNFYMMYGPNTNLGHSSILLMSESQAHYIAQCVATAARKGWHSLDVRPDAMAQYFGEIQRRLEGMIWNQIQTSWYKAPDGTLPNNWPGRTIEYRRRTRKPVFADFEIRLPGGRTKI